MRNTHKTVLKMLVGMIVIAGWSVALIKTDFLGGRSNQVLAAGVVKAAAEKGTTLLSEQDMKEMNEQLRRNGYSFTVGPNSATKYRITQLCGIIPTHENLLKAQASEGLPTLQVTLPSKFDWRDQDGLTPVRNQGNCGSCWAFSSIGSLEANIKIKDKKSVDLSEQQLVSCNKNGWGCNGGWWAHSMFQSSGAATESAFPYKAADVACQNVALSYKIDRWGYVGNSNSVPSTAAIKSAIYQYGPVTVAVYVDSYFQAYKSGVFNRSASGQPNHGVVLVGWDDSQNCWIMRNSWGSGWGESGYMRIAYGTSLIGYGASYLVYKGGVAPAPPNGTTPQPTATPKPTPTPTAGTTNLLLKQSTRASGYLSGYEPAKAVDGDASSRWAVSSGRSQWLEVNLKQSCSAGNLKISWSKTNYPKTYSVQGWNGSSWMTLKTVTGGDGDLDQISLSSTKSFSKLRINCTSRASSYYLIYELELYATAKNNQPANKRGGWTRR